MRRLVQLAAVLAAATCIGASGSASGELRLCATKQYSYAGFAASHQSFGVSARITPLASPDVLDGHVAAWVGVGGPGPGPRGADGWLQVGLSALRAGGASTVSDGLARPRQAPPCSHVRCGTPAGAVLR